MATDIETVADIIAEMRSDANADDYTPDGILGQKLNYIADRLDAAHKRELATAENSSAVGNAAKLREVCKQFLELLAAPIGFEYCGMSLELDEEQVVMWRDRFLDALAAPARNCNTETNAKTPETITVKPLSLDDAIPHADEVAGDCGTACKREHKQLADWLRELKNRRNGSGDAAKLREALEFCVKCMCGFCRMDAEARGMTTKCVHGCEALRKAKAALAAPPRNCDRFAAETDAQIAFLNEAWLIGVSNLDRDPFDGWTNEMKSAYSKWLFAPATEKEGSSK